jgi:hypothetical protein
MNFLESFHAQGSQDATDAPQGGREATMPAEIERNLSPDSLPEALSRESTGLSVTKQQMISASKEKQQADARCREEPGAVSGGSAAPTRPTPMNPVEGVSFDTLNISAVSAPLADVSSSPTASPSSPPDPSLGSSPETPRRGAIGGRKIKRPAKTLQRSSSSPSISSVRIDKVTSMAMFSQDSHRICLAESGRENTAVGCLVNFLSFFLFE